jgi:uncharacterized protein
VCAGGRGDSQEREEGGGRDYREVGEPGIPEPEEESARKDPNGPDMRFVCDAMLGKLAKYLRIFGLDAPYVKGGGDFAGFTFHDESSYFLTRRTHIRPGSRLVVIRSVNAPDQVKEIRDVIAPHIDFGKVMTRCIDCNTPLAAAPREDIEPLVPEFVFHHYETFMVCPSCGKVYWRGSHAKGMSRFTEEVFGERKVE